MKLKKRITLLIQTNWPDFFGRQNDQAFPGGKCPFWQHFASFARRKLLPQFITVFGLAYLLEGEYRVMFLVICNINSAYSCISAI